MNRVIKGKIESFCRHYNGDPFHAVLCDPPYHLTSIVKRFANGEPSHTKTARDIANRSTPHARQAAGFMGKQWDGGDVAFKPETWVAIASLLYPGAFIFAFAGTRGYHRMAVAMEDAGLIIHPAIGWVFGSGFPKATRIDTQIDSAAGEVGKPSDYKPNNENKVYGDGMGGGITTRQYESVTPLAKEWTGHRYGLQALKPAFEFIAVAQKPYKGRSVDCISRTGAGALNIEGARIGIDEVGWSGLPSSGYSGGLDSIEENGRPVQGRWPANFALCHSPECNGECVEGCPIEMLDDQSNDIHSAGYSQPKQEKWNPEKTEGWGNIGTGPSGARFGDSGGASRFFFNADYMHERLEDSDPIVYQAKAGKSERNAGLIEFEEKQSIGYQYSDQPNDPANGMFKDRNTVKRNHHPTVKSISLCKYLATLLLPPDSYASRRLLVPFSGSGSEMIGARLAGWEKVVGVEMTGEYVDIARARLAWWESKLLDGHTDIDRMLAAWNKESETSNDSDYQMSIFD